MATFKSLPQRQFDWAADAPASILSEARRCLPFPHARQLLFLKERIEAAFHQAGLTSCQTKGEEDQDGPDGNPGYPHYPKKFPDLPFEDKKFAYAFQFHKLFRHNKHTGLLEGDGLQSYADLITGLRLDPQDSSFDQASLNKVIFADPKSKRVLINPQTSKALAIKGGDALAFDAGAILNGNGLTPTADLAKELSFSSAESAAEMVEVYAMALLRSENFDAYSADDPAIKLVIDALNAFPEFKGRTAPNEPITVETLFRGNGWGSRVGPYISQFLLQRRPPLFPSGCAPAVNQDINAGIFFERHARFYEVPRPNKREFGVTWCEFVALQNGSIPRKYVENDFLDLTTVRCGRDLASLVHTDGLYEEYVWAADILTAGDYGRTAASPYTTLRDPTGEEIENSKIAAREGDGLTLGPPDAVGLVGAVALEAARAAWTQKWLFYRRARPEVFAGMIEKRPQDIALEFDERIMESTAPQAVKNLYAQVRLYNRRQANLPGYPSEELVSEGDAENLLLTQIFPEGSPSHPAWPSGHAVIAGACVTVLKAIFNDLAPMRTQAQQPKDIPDGKGGVLKVGGELDKLASNVALGRNFAGVHFRSDGEHGIQLGEALAIQFLMDHLRSYREQFREPGSINQPTPTPYFDLTKRNGQRVRITAECCHVIDEKPGFSFPQTVPDADAVL